MWGESVHFKIQELLGEGGQGQVFKALRRDRRTGLSQTVAIKILHSGIAVETWKREFESLAKVRSPYCVKAHGFERIRGRPALVLEYVEGVSLLALGRACWLDPDDIQEILAQAECAILDLYKYSAFHGDLSPQNILIDREGHLRLLDFGMANCARDNIRLTPEFAAPERLVGAKASLAADIFSLGKIEQFLSGNPGTLSPYLHLEPSRRAMRGAIPKAEAQKKLGTKVQALLEKRALHCATHTLNPTPKITRPKAWLTASITACFLMLASSQGRGSIAHAHALLHLRTTQWHYFLLDGSPLGYAPVSAPINSSKSHTLEWVSAKGRGKKSFRISPGQSLTFRDRDFSH